MLLGNLSEYRAILSPPLHSVCYSLSVFFSRESSFADDSSEYPWNVCSKTSIEKMHGVGAFQDIFVSRPFVQGTTITFSIKDFFRASFPSSFFYFFFFFI